MSPKHKSNKFRLKYLITAMQYLYLFKYNKKGCSICFITEMQKKYSFLKILVQLQAK